MKPKAHLDPRRKQESSRLAWLEEPLRYWGKPWLVGLWLSGVIAAVILSLVPGTWISLTRRFPDFPSSVADVMELSSHFFGYAVLVGFVTVACKTWSRLIAIYIVAIFIGIVSEMLQFFLPQRGASFIDLSMNVLGASAGFLFGLAQLKRKRRVPPGGEDR